MLKPADYGLIVFIAALWGSSYIYIRLLVPVLGPWGLVSSRMLLAGAVLLVAGRIQGVRWGEWRLWREYVVMAFLSAVVAQFLISYAALTLNGATLSILNTTTAMFGAALSVWLLHERLSGRRAAGLALGVIGVAMVVGFAPLAFTPAVALAFAATLGGSLGYAASNIYAVRKLKGRPALELAVVQSMFAAAMALPLGLPGLVDAWPLAPRLVVALLVLAVVCTAAANWLYYILMRRTSPTVSLSVTYLIPCFSMLWGWLFLGETIAVLQLAGFAVVLAALWLVASRSTGRST